MDSTGQDRKAANAARRGIRGGTHGGAHAYLPPLLETDGICPVCQSRWHKSMCPRNAIHHVWDKDHGQGYDHGAAAAA